MTTYAPVDRIMGTRPLDSKYKRSDNCHHICQVVKRSGQPQRPYHTQQHKLITTPCDSAVTCVTNMVGVHYTRPTLTLIALVMHRVIKQFQNMHHALHQRLLQSTERVAPVRQPKVRGRSHHYHKCSVDVHCSRQYAVNNRDQER